LAGPLSAGALKKAQLNGSVHVPVMLNEDSSAKTEKKAVYNAGME